MLECTESITMRPLLPHHHTDRHNTQEGCSRESVYQPHLPHLEQVALHEQRAAQAQLARSLQTHSHDLRPGPAQRNCIGDAQ
eukprot:1160464-Pelagomonas_calceolata.AAC.2